MTTLVTTVLAVAGCTTGGATDKAGGSDAPTTLTLIDVASSLEAFPAVEYFIDRVAEVSDGQLTINVKLEWTGFVPDAEQRIVHDVAAGKADLARIGTRAFDRLGVTSLQALTAPLLIDNYPLQTAVIDSPMPEEMLTGLEPLGVTGIGVLAGQLRKPIAATKPLLAPADWSDLTFQTRASDLENATAEALGATTTEIVGTVLKEAVAKHEVDGLAIDLANGDLTTQGTPYVAANVNLWPQTIALIVNSDRLAKLTDQQRGWLQTAAADAVTYSTQNADQDPAHLAELCEGGARFAEATPAQLAAYGEALAPVYADLERDAVTQRYLDQIRQLKADTPPGPGLTIPEECTGPAPIREGINADAEDTSALNGTYRVTHTLEDARTWPAEHGLPPETDESLKAYPNTATTTLKDGTWTSRESSFPGQEGHGTYAVRGNLITWCWPDGCQTYGLTVNAHGDLQLSRTPSTSDDGLMIMVAKPWIKIG